jgi:ketosteroid isomerase-like protein
VSDGNADVARRALRLWSEGDLEGTLETMRPDVEWHLAFAIPDLPTGKRVYRGHDEVRQVWNAFRSVWSQITIKIDEVIHDADDLLVLRARFNARGGASGIEIERTIFYVMRMKEGLLAELRPYEGVEEARQAAGLRS